MKTSRLFISMFFCFLICFLGLPDILYGQADYQNVSRIDQNLYSPLRLAVDSDDNIYVTETSPQKVIRYDASGVYLETIDMSDRPVAIAVNSNDKVFVGMENGQIVCLDGGIETVVIEMEILPSDMVFGINDVLYVVDQADKHVKVFDIDFNLMLTIGDGLMTYPSTIAFDKENERIMVTEQGGEGPNSQNCGGMMGSWGPPMKVYIFDLDGAFIDDFGCHGNDPGKFERIQGITMGNCGNIFVNDPFQGRVTVFNTDGNYITHFGEWGQSAGQLRMPMDLVFDSQGRIIIPVMNNKTIEFFSLTDTLPMSVMSNCDTTFCSGGSADIEISFTGTAPWTFTYTKDGIDPVTVTDNFTNPYVFTVTEGGLYEISDLSDANYSGTCFSGSALISVNSVSPTSTISNADTTICNGLEAAIPIDFTGAGPWTFTYTIDGGSPSIVSTTQNPYPLSTKDAGLYEVTAVSSGGCVGSVFVGTATVTVKDEPTSVFSAGDVQVPVCAGDSVDLMVEFTGEGPWGFTYTIDGEGEYIVSSGFSPVFPLTVADAGVYEVVEVRDANCFSTATMASYPEVVTGTPTLVSYTHYSGVVDDLCDGETAHVYVTLDGELPTSFKYVYNGTDTISVDNVNSDSHLLLLDENGTFELIETSNQYCTDNSSMGLIELVRNPLPSAVLSDVNTIMCSGESMPVSVSFTGSPPWYINYTDGATEVYLSASYDNPTMLNLPSGGVYQLTGISDSICYSTSVSGTAQIDAYPMPVADLSVPTAICQGETSDITVSITDGTGPWDFEYTIDGVNPVPVTTFSPTYIIPATQTGLYEVSILSDVNCTNTNIVASAQLSVNPLPAADIAGTTTICDGETSDIIISITDGTGPWNFEYTVDGINPVSASTNDPTYVISTSTSGLYEIVTLSDINCTNTNNAASAQLNVGSIPVATLSGTYAQCGSAPADIPVTFTGGTAPWDFEYTIDGQNPVSVSSSTSTYLIPATQAGLYEITSLSDANCTGTNLGGIAQVISLPMPVASISGTPSICLGESTDITVHLTQGAWPWSFEYTIDGANPVVVTPTGLTHTISTTQAGLYEVSSLTDNNCTDTNTGSSTQLTVNNLPVATISGTASVCEGESTDLTVSFTDGTGPWNFEYTIDGMNPVSISSDASSYLISATEAGVYEIISLSDINCTGIDISGLAQLTSLPVPAGDISGASEICEGETSDITVTFTSGTGPWDFEYTIDGQNPVQVSTSNSTYVIPATQQGLYEISTLSDVNCTNTNNVSSAELTVHPLPSAHATASDSICPNDVPWIYVYFTQGTGPWNFEYTVNGVNPVSVSSDYPVYNIPATTGEEYEIITLSDMYCTGTDLGDSVQMELLPSPSAYVVSTDSICEGDVADISVSFNEGTGPWNFWYSHDGQNTVSVLTYNSVYIISATEAGLYEIGSLSDWNCGGADSVGSAQITVNQLPVADFSFIDDSVDVSFINSSSNANSFWWDFGDTQSSSDTDPVHTYQSNGEYVVTMTASNAACGDSVITDTISIYLVGIENNGLLSTLRVYPNPTDGLITLEISSGDPDLQVEILSITGQQVYYDKIAPGISKEHVDLSSFANGVYTIRLMSGDKVSTTKLILSK